MGTQCASGLRTAPPRRNTRSNILVALGVDPGSVMDQLGHTDPGFTLRVYRYGMRRDRAAKERLRVLVGGADWQPPDAEAPRAVAAEIAGLNPA
jgi:hypothetical protein